MQIVYNLHIIEACNYRCEFCFAKWNENDGLPMICKDKKSVEKLFNELAKKDVIGGMIGEQINGVRINFAGGEPLMLGDTFTDIVKLAKDMGFETSLITNGSLFERCLGVIKYLDMVGISIDSLDEDACKAMGRCSKNGDYMFEEKVAALVSQIRRENPNTKLKLNTVVSRHNCLSNIVERLQAFKPDRLKVLRQLSFNGKGGISDIEFEQFLEINKNAVGSDNVVVENTDDITQSYLMLDPYGRFFQNGNETTQGYVYSEPIHVIGLKCALSQISFNKEKFMSRYKEENNHE